MNQSKRILCTMLLFASCAQAPESAMPLIASPASSTKCSSGNAPIGTINVNPVININPVFNPNFQFNPTINIPITISNTISVVNNNNIVVDNETGTRALKQQILAYARNAQELEQLEKASGGKVIGGDKQLGLIQIELPSGKDPFQVSQELEQQGLSTSPNFVADPNNQTQDPFWQDADQSWGHKMLKLDQVWSLVEPGAIKIAVIEFGGENHNDLKMQQIGETVGYAEHGNHVTGIINGIADNNLGITGVMKGKADLKLYSVSYDFASIAQGVRKAVDDGNKIINMSLGVTITGERSDDVLAKMIKKANVILIPAIEYARSKGVLIVTAAGNGLVDADNQLIRALDAQYESPASLSKSHDNVITVAAVEQNGSKTSFSNYGDFVTVAAPGKAIYSTVKENAYAPDDGTSMAAPYVTGIAGLLLSKNPSLNYLQLKEAIVLSASVKVPEQNFGIVDALKALELSASVTGKTVQIEPSNSRPTAPLASPSPSASIVPVSNQSSSQIDCS